MRRSRVGVVLAVLVAVSVFAAACGDDGDSATTDGESTTSTTVVPQSGGVLTFGQYAAPPSLDPIVALGSGTTGGIEMSAIYDTIMRWNPDTKKYEPRTAESLTSSADFTEWTIKVKPGIKFTDGTAYDAAAVVFGLNRHRSGTAGAPPCAEVVACPRNSTSSSVYMALVKDVQVIDALTVKVSLTQPWSAFAYALSDEAGLIPSPTALRKCDAAKDIRECEFNLKPVGAGPFVLESYKAKEAITLTRNPNYYGGVPYLDGLRFVDAGDAGGMRTYDLFKTGQVKMAYLRDPAATNQAHADKVTGHALMAHGGGIFLLNQGATVTCAGGKPEPTCAGQPDGPVTTNPPTKNLKVRQAIAAAIDPVVVDQRANAGKGLPGTDLLQSDFTWFPAVSGPKYDPTAAKRLVEEAKAGGWDGKLRFLYNSAPVSQAVALAVQSMLQAAGMTVTVDVSKDVAGQIAQMTVGKDYDMAGLGTSLTDDDGAMVALVPTLSSTSVANRANYKNATVDQALRDLFAAPNDDAKKAAFRKVIEQVNLDLPVLAWSKVEEYNVYAPTVHGLTFNHSGSVLLDKAWLGN